MLTYHWLDPRNLHLKISSAEWQPFFRPQCLSISADIKPPMLIRKPISYLNNTDVLQFNMAPKLRVIIISYLLKFPECANTSPHPVQSTPNMQYCKLVLSDLVITSRHFLLSTVLLTCVGNINVFCALKIRPMRAWYGMPFVNKILTCVYGHNICLDLETTAWLRNLSYCYNS